MADITSRTQSLTTDFLLEIEHLYWERVDVKSEDECWPWLGASRRNGGPPTLSIDGITHYAYRIGYQLAYGDLEKDAGVKHSCNNVLCMNPKHLYSTSSDKYRWESEEAVERRRKHTEYMAAYMNDPLHPERKEKANKRARSYGKANGQQINDRSRKYYRENQEQIRIDSAELQMRHKIRAIEYLGGKCIYCGANHPSVLQFHHREPELKGMNLTTKELSSTKKYPWDTVIKPELDKCDLICANCHFIEHGTISLERALELKQEFIDKIWIPSTKGSRGSAKNKRINA